MTPKLIIPFHIELKELYRHIDRDEHELKFGVVGVDVPAVVIIASDRFESPIIIERCIDGALGLDEQLFDAFALKCYSLMASQIREHDGDSGWWSIRDLSTFIKKQFTGDNVAHLLQALSRQVKEGMPTSSVCMVVDDDAL